MHQQQFEGGEGRARLMSRQTCDKTPNCEVKNPDLLLKRKRVRPVVRKLQE